MTKARKGKYTVAQRVAFCAFVNEALTTEPATTNDQLVNAWRESAILRRIIWDTYTDEHKGLLIAYARRMWESI
jgi:hypothetical protein